MFKLKISWSTEKHIGDELKPNEDAILFDFKLNAVAMADGITRSKLKDGSYPSSESIIPAQTFVTTVINELSNLYEYSSFFINKVMVKANEAIERTNIQHSLTSVSVDYENKDYLGTTGSVICLFKDIVIFSYVGDVIAFYLPYKNKPILLTEDQQFDCNTKIERIISGIDPGNDIPELEALKSKRTIWKRKNARNNIKSGYGYGAFTGEKKAEDFVVSKTIYVQAGDKFILSTDALRSILNLNLGEEESCSSYSAMFDLVKKTSFDAFPADLIRLIRENETYKKVRSDDATVCIVEIV